MIMAAVFGGGGQVVVRKLSSKCCWYMTRRTSCCFKLCLDSRKTGQAKNFEKMCDCMLPQV